MNTLVFRETLSEAAEILSTEDGAWETLAELVVQFANEYKGFTNFETHSVWVWIHESEQRVSEFNRYIKRTRHDEEYNIRDYFIDGIPISAQDSIYHKLLVSTLNGVDWYQLLEKLADEAQS